MKQELINLGNKEFIKISDGNINILFSTAENGVSYRLKTEEGEKNLRDLKDLFKVKEVHYTNQIHSDIIFDLKDVSAVTEKEGDGLLTNKINEIIGVFAADCVPVILYDEEKKVIAAVHSGWRGTIADISKKAAEEMKVVYGAKEIKVIIGPHVGNCCYEVSEELSEKFNLKYGEQTSNGRMLSLETAIRRQLKGIVREENISSLNLCTNCNEEYKLHSYRKFKEQSGRLFSFVYISE